MMEDIDNKTDAVPAFQFQNSTLNNRYKDLFSSLDALEKKHNEFEVTRAKEDAESDRRLITQGPSHEELETVTPQFKRPSCTGRDYHESKKGGRHGQERVEQHEQFRKPKVPQNSFRGRNRGRGRFSRGRATPDYKLHPERWTEYSLEDVDVSDSSNKQAAFDFLNERRKLREEGLTEEKMNMDSSACSKGLIAFKRPTKVKRDSDIDNKNDVIKMDSHVTSNAEEMEEDVCDTDASAHSSANMDFVVDSTDGRNSLKRKLEEIEISDDTEVSSAAMQKASFRSRKSSKKQIRSRTRDEEDDD